MESHLSPDRIPLEESATVIRWSGEINRQENLTVAKLIVIIAVILQMASLIGEFLASSPFWQNKFFEIGFTVGSLGLAAALVYLRTLNHKES